MVILWGLTTRRRRRSVSPACPIRVSGQPRPELPSNLHPTFTKPPPKTPSNFAPTATLSGELMGAETDRLCRHLADDFRSDVVLDPERALLADHVTHPVLVADAKHEVLLTTFEALHRDDHGAVDHGGAVGGPHEAVLPLPVVHELPLSVRGDVPRPQQFEVLITDGLGARRARCQHDLNPDTLHGLPRAGQHLQRRHGRRDSRRP